MTMAIKPISTGASITFPQLIPSGFVFVIPFEFLSMEVMSCPKDRKVCLSLYSSIFLICSILDFFSSLMTSIRLFRFR